MAVKRPANPFHQRKFGTKTCERCGRVFEKQSPAEKYCVPCRPLAKQEHTKQWWHTVCPSCGKPKYRTSPVCRGCYRKPENTGPVCPDCGGPKTVYSAYCQKCYGKHFESPNATNWVTDYVEPLFRLKQIRLHWPTLQQDQFVVLFRQGLLDLDRIYREQGRTLGEHDAAEVIGIESGKIHTWLGLGESMHWSRPLRPRLHHVPGIARLLVLAAGHELTQERWDQEMVRVCQLLWGRKPAPTGLLIVRKLWEQGRSRRSLERALTGYPLHRLIFKGFATRPKLERVADALGMDAEARHLLLTLARPRDETHRTARMRQNRALRDHAKEQQKTAWEKLDQAEAEYVRQHGKRPSPTRLRDMTGVRLPSIHEWQRTKERV